MKQWWQSKNQREQRGLMLLACFSLIVIVWYGIFTPLTHLTTNLRQENKKLSKERQWLNEQAALAGIIAVKLSNVTLEESVIQSGKKAGLVLQVKTSEQKSALVTLEALPLSQLTQWLEKLKADDGIYPVELRFDASGAGKQYVDVVILRLKKAE